ncbi:MAG: hypothetical protein H6830_12685 [Planctomycetes bacterium]|nr:hypothetical protein [Planctomycetota bacterium]HPF13539.1 hypothetical protein [Planctomycetota bacterium]HRV80343.1 hypothetical protein [Planctomycetota bacterium]
MTTDPARLLKKFETAKSEFGGDAAQAKRELLSALQSVRLPNASAILRLHEALCYLRALPDNAEILGQVVAMLETFDQRKDVHSHREELADSGLRGMPIYYWFFPDTARWLSGRFPGALQVDWEMFEDGEKLRSRLDLLGTWTETLGLDEADLPIEDWVARMAGPHTTDADFLIQRSAHVGRTDAERDRFYEELNLPLVLQPGPKTPSRTLAHLEGRPVHYQTTPLRRQRPDLQQALRQPVREIVCDKKLGERIVSLAREAMVLRHRDLDAFSYGDPNDVRLFDCGDGLEFGVIGVRPERRLMLEAVYAYITLKNGVPIGYVLTSALFGSSEIAYNVFDTWRGGEAAHVYGCVLAVTRRLFGSDTFTIYPYQLGGGGNTEGLKSGSWWFYQKLGFRAREPHVRKVMERELAKMRKDPKYKTSIETLEDIAEYNVYWTSGRERDDVIGVFGLGNVGLRLTAYLAERFGADRERGLRTCAEEAAKLCGVRGLARWTKHERLWWERWSPLVLALPGINHWSKPEYQALVAIVRAKGGRRESDFVRLLDAHRKLRAGLRKLARPVE